MSSPSARDLLAIAFKPRQTMRRVLDSGADRWTAALIVLAFICSSFGDPDIRNLGKELPDLTLVPTLAFVALVLIVIAACWVGALYLFSWLVSFVGKYLDGRGTWADVRAAMAWGLVPFVWSIAYRIPVGLYRSKVKIPTGSPIQVSIDLIQGGACSLALIALVIQIAFDIWLIWVESSTVAEALRVETWKGFSALAISIAVPVVAGIAAVLAFRN